MTNWDFDNRQQAILVILLYLCFLVPTRVQSQIVVEESDIEVFEELFVLYSDSSLNITNVSIDCAEENPAFGLFFHEKNFLEIDSGFVLTTGLLSNVTGPNDQPDISFAQDGLDTDIELELIQDQFPIYDKCAVEFDFVSDSSFVYIDFQIGSDEYPESVGQPYSDVFGIFIENIRTGIAILSVYHPTGAPVSINEVNHKDTPDFYLDNGDGTSNDVEEYPNAQYDGFSKMLIAGTNIEPGEMYHFKIAIGDIGDDTYDSGIFFSGLHDASCVSQCIAVLGNNESVFNVPYQVLHTEDQLNVIPKDGYEIETFSIYDASGIKQLHTTQNKELHLNFSDLHFTPGIYFYKLEVGGVSVSDRFIVF